MAMMRKGKLFVNLISEISWETAKSTLGEELKLKGGPQELKGPCPNCGGDDRFWIKKGNKLPFIFGCRAGCSFSDIIKDLADRGLIENEKLSEERIHAYKKEQPVPYQMNVWAWAVLDCVELGGCCEDEDIMLFMKAVEVLKRAQANGVMQMHESWVWDIAKLRERGLINEYL